MRRRPTAATIVLALAFAIVGCAGDAPKEPGKRPRSKAAATCVGAECRVRVTCKGKVYVRVGPAPVDVRSSTTALRTSITADFAGTRHDALIRC